MRNRLFILVPALVVLCFLLTVPSTASACAEPEGDLMYVISPESGFGKAETCGFGPAASAPPLTQAGEERIKQNIPTSPRSPLQKRVEDPSQSNDPALTCNPKGFPQIVVDTAHDHHEVIQLPNRIMQIWQEERRLREIWMDGRKLPEGVNYANLGPSWYGISVGNWEGNTLVVETIGLDDRAWLDIYGFPKSEEARIVERYTRINATTMQVQLTLNDPKYYKAPWVSDIKTFKKEARDGKQVNHFGWYGLFSGLTELICAPVNASGDPSNPRGGE